MDSAAPAPHSRLTGCLPLILLFCLMLPVTAMVPVLPALTLGRFAGLGEFQSHLFMSVNMLGALIGAPLAGLLSDRLGRRKPLAVAALAANGLALLAIAHALKAADAYGGVLALRLLEGFCHMASLSLLMALGADQAAHHQLGAKMGAVGAAISLGVAAGAPLGGWLGGIDPLWVPRAGGVLSLAMAALALFGLRDGAQRRARLPAGEILRTLRSRRGLAIPLAFSFVDRLTVGFIISTLVLYLGSVLGFDARAIGAAMAAFLVPFSLLTWPAGHLCRRIDPLAMMVAGSILYGVFLATLGFVPPARFVLVMAGGGVIAALMYAPSLVLAAQYGGADCRASALAAFNMAGSLGFAAGPLLSGALLAFFRLVSEAPYPPVFILVGALEAGLAVLVWTIVRRGYFGPAPAAPEAR